MLFVRFLAQQQTEQTSGPGEEEAAERDPAMHQLEAGKSGAEVAAQERFAEAHRQMMDVGWICPGITRGEVGGLDPHDRAVPGNAMDLGEELAQIPHVLDDVVGPKVRVAIVLDRPGSVGVEIVDIIHARIPEAIDAVEAFRLGRSATDVQSVVHEDRTFVKDGRIRLKSIAIREFPRSRIQDP